MNASWQIPFNAVYATSAGCVVLALIQLGSTLAFNIIVSLSVLGLMSTYLLSIGCVFLKRLKGEPLPHARWSLGRWGFAINGIYEDGPCCCNPADQNIRIRTLLLCIFARLLLFSKVGLQDAMLDTSANAA
ncbi:hypothetical protein LTR56_025907 [Elasticomyces elasticus]|nr:hypothetical protein LTR56_025907 [Elasticomyces elasticus]KAK3655062.1 hypothetical protein LTR22_010530 [Elasticomyces elasticus]